MKCRHCVRGSRFLLRLESQAQIPQHAVVVVPKLREELCVGQRV